MAIDEDYANESRTTLNPRLAVRLLKGRVKTRQLLMTEAERITHKTGLLNDDRSLKSVYNQRVMTLGRVGSALGAVFGAGDAVGPRKVIRIYGAGFRCAVSAMGRMKVFAGAGLLFP